MHGLEIEYRELKEKDSLAFKLANDICERSHFGKVAIVASQPFNLMRVVRKHFVKIERHLHVERARTLDAAKIKEFSSRLAYMQSLKFTSKPPTDQLEASVTFATADDFVKMPPVCPTLFVTYIFPREKLHMMTSWMTRDGVVIIYEK